MMKNGKEACDWCGKVFQKKTPVVRFHNSKDLYHQSCYTKVGGRTDLGRI